MYQKPETEGTYVVYYNFRSPSNGGQGIAFKPVTVGAEMELSIGGVNPIIAGGIIAFQMPFLVPNLPEANFWPLIQHEIHFTLMACLSVHSYDTLLRM